MTHVAPPGVPLWKVRVLQALRRVPPLSSRRVRARYLRTRRAQSRARRRAEEARGSDRLSRPGLHDLDAKLERHLGDLRGGFFVEAGANDGFEQSNTYRLERLRGWRGVLVEPVPHLYREAVLERPGATVFHCALVPFGHPEDEVELQYGGLMTIVAGQRGSEQADTEYVSTAFLLGLEDPFSFRVPARPLSDLLDEAQAPEIDFMSLDVEGFEPQVLRGLDLERHAPRLLLVEAHGAAARAAVEAVLGDRYEAVEAITPQDVLYRRVARTA
jgi:FkbM family methyltransferase